MGTQAKVGISLLTLWLFVIVSLWGFAFLPAPEISPEWLLRTQAVCFGTNAHGLPGPQGWMLLIAGPLSLLAFMLATHSGELAAVPGFVRASRPALAATALIAVGLMTEAHFVGRRITNGVRVARISFESPEKSPLPADYPRTALGLPEFSLRDQHGKSFATPALKGSVSIVTFAYAHCATVCPVLVHSVLEAEKRLHTQGANTQAVFITLDPWRDTPATLGARARAWNMGDHDYLLSGEPALVEKTLKEFGVAMERNLKTGEITHPAQVLLVDRDGKIAYQFLNPPVDWLVAAAERLAH